MRKVYVILSDNSPEFVFSSMEKAMRQIEVIRDLNKKGKWWVGGEIMEEVYANSLIAIDGYYPSNHRYQLRFKNKRGLYVTYTIKEMKLNDGYGL